jgi:hypothetical protein
VVIPKILMGYLIDQGIPCLMELTHSLPRPSHFPLNPIPNHLNLGFHSNAIFIKMHYDNIFSKPILEKILCFLDPKYHVLFQLPGHVRNPFKSKALCENFITHVICTSIGGIVTGYKLDDWGIGVQVLVASRVWTSPYNSYWPWVHPASYLMGTMNSKDAAWLPKAGKQLYLCIYVIFF